MIVTWAYVVKK